MNTPPDTTTAAEDLRQLERVSQALLGWAAGSHHGAPDLFERDVVLLEHAMLWIRTVREAGNPSYTADWVPRGRADYLKSRLFWRIRSGKTPLQYAPPCAYSCPWYELIEEDRPHYMFEEPRIYDAYAFSARANNDPRKWVTICQSMYRLESTEPSGGGAMTVSYNDHYRFRVIPPPPEPSRLPVEEQHGKWAIQLINDRE